ncbi:TrwC relaxase [Xylanimonas cellulosilytica DSM 15894]|uniref:TrwC relaxase n=1 Tax=Xylanimonas cellulosilytica (strain DSM 15894 / JCM 12276 / CECT 5975 / KCTC 9989 / LMG 20990 / NBRC 107835 / XIL07) TaxID=446471 RepID=D1BVN4_XYLCX|nr:MobF family relaxase [Xylanimonas cellulosilytica]ACZ31353.1 TrwC relaxase [Xylanimonas cellulosilytica DSM 15894]
MTVSLRVMSAGNGYEYLLRSVVSGDGNRSLGTPLTRYYLDEGTPPGFWMGSGVAAFGNGELAAGDAVTPGHLVRLLGHGVDPTNPDVALGKPYPQFSTPGDRIETRVGKLPESLSAGERADAVAAITAEEERRGTRTAVAGYDLTFSVSKSVSVLWALADADTQARIADVHHAAVADVIALFERDIAATRTGSHSVNQEAVVGIAAAAFDHYDSRANDPQLHTHVVVSNKVKTLRDGQWRSLDGRPIHAATVALSEYYNAVLADRMAAEFGVGWEQRDRGESRSVAWEIAGVPETLIDEFSSRSRAIDEETDRLVDEYTATRGRRPSSATIIRLRAQATLDTRPEKQIHSLADLSAGWRTRATRHIGGDPTAWARALTRSVASPALTVDRVPADLIAEVGARVVAAVGEKRSTWRHWNLWAETSRQTMGWRFATTADRERLVAVVVASAEAQSVRLTPPDLAATPAAFRREDGTSRFRPAHTVAMSSHEILDAEQRLIDRGENRTAPVVVTAALAAANREVVDPPLSGEQRHALGVVSTSGRQIDLLIGPAGAGKTTAMSALRRAWTIQYGPGSVVGLAPSAAAAKVLAEDLAIACDNTAKWLHEHDRGRADFHAGQLVIIDEATLASTLTLDRITALAAAAGAKVLLVGDHAQLQSVDAGGAFSLLRHERRGDVAHLTEVHRFINEWEKDASLALRSGEVEVIDTYIARGRVRAGTGTEMVDAAYAAWRADIRAGRRTLLVTDSADHVRELNARARAERILDGDTLPDREVSLADDAAASVGDLVITRRNDRALRTPRGGWVRNGDRWRIIDVHRSGDVEVRREGYTYGAAVVLPTEYVAQHLDLGYAVTAYRAQGMTVDTCHVVVAPGATRENLYVAMTRGRDANTAYVALDCPDDLHAHPVNGAVTAQSVLAGVLAHTGGELSAHETIAAEQDRYASIAQLAAEYETIATLAQADRWPRVIAHALDAAGERTTNVDEVVASEAYGALCNELWRLDAAGVNVDDVVSRAIDGRGFADADDVAAVITWRLWNLTGRTRTNEPDLIAGLIPRAHGDFDDETRAALDERADLIEQRAAALAEGAIRDGARWIAGIGDEPSGADARRAWSHAIAVEAAYRDRYSASGRRSVAAAVPASVAQSRDRDRVLEAIARVRTVEQLVGRSSHLDLAHHQAPHL